MNSIFDEVELKNRLSLEELDEIVSSQVLLLLMALESDPRVMEHLDRIMDTSFLKGIQVGALSARGVTENDPLDFSQSLTEARQFYRLQEEIMKRCPEVDPCPF